MKQASRDTFCVSLARQAREAGDAKSKIPKEIYDYELFACDPHVYVSFLWLSSIFYVLPSYLLKRNPRRNHHKLRSRIRIESNLINSSLCASDWRIECAIEGVCKMNFYASSTIVFCCCEKTMH